MKRVATPREGARFATGRQCRQRGIAAIEFAFTFTFLFLVIYGIATFGSVLYVQQAVSRAGEDGARALSQPSMMGLSDDALRKQRVQDAVHESLAGSLVVPEASNADSTSRLGWIKSHVTVTVVMTGAGGSAPATGAVVTVAYPYSANRLLPSLPLLDTSRWMPDTVTGRAAAALPS
ncbi:Flp pilus assembly protein TadG [Variovorax boronicumulans]|nr:MULTISPECIES: TadE/TadG family type IV pilus assembly protein [Variovorax]MDQ0085248.1 Flp pilus assembly protein TadG [Variovorax boronicumulans]